MENLRHLLFQYNSSWPLVFGQRYLNEGYMASGSVLLSKEALYRLAVQSIPDNKKCDMRWDGHSGLGLQRWPNI